MKKLRTGIGAFLAMLILILDTKTAVAGAADGVELCLRTVIPSLFPFFILSILLTSSLTGRKFRFLCPLGKFCGIPEGCESLLLIGLLGGYPTGAAAVAQTCREGKLSESVAKRMLGFCSNAGPSFLFGIAAASLGDVKYGWVLWSIHILSALAAGYLLPGSTRERAGTISQKQITLSQALERSIGIMARVCGWIILFRVILAFLIRWFLWLLPGEAQVAVMGLLELTIGCTRLGGLEFAKAFILCAALLAFGGVCVLLQTVSVTQGLSLGMYIPGKLIQTLVSTLLATVYIAVICREPVSAYLIAFPAICLISLFFLFKSKIGVAIWGKTLYNRPICKRLVMGNAIPKEN